jgi:hypothetical protein
MPLTSSRRLYMIAFDRGPRFSLGRVVVTPGAMAKLPSDEVVSALQRHARGDWGVLDSEDRQQNELALERGATLASIFCAEDGTRFYVITEADRTVTTVLLPEEY